MSQQLLLPLTADESSRPSHPEHGAPPPRTEDPALIRDFARRLEERSNGRIVELTLTRNRSTFLSAKPLAKPRPALQRGLAKRVQLRLHECFLNAPEPVIEAVVDFASKRLTKQRRRETLDVLRGYFDAHGPTAPPARRPPRPLDPSGQHHDLRPLFEGLNRTYFDGALHEVIVGWGEPVRRRRRRRRTIQLGSYQDETKTVRMHPILDRPEVPTYVVEAVLHHEMVHAVVPAEPSASGTRRRVHTEAFRQREREFAQYERAERWLERHLFRLMGRVERSLAKQ